MKLIKLAWFCNFTEGVFISFRCFFHWEKLFNRKIFSNNGPISSNFSTMTKIIKFYSSQSFMSFLRIHWVSFNKFWLVNNSKRLLLIRIYNKEPFWRLYFFFNFITNSSKCFKIFSRDFTPYTNLKWLIYTQNLRYNIKFKKKALDQNLKVMIDLKTIYLLDSMLKSFCCIFSVFDQFFTWNK